MNLFWHLLKFNFIFNKVKIAFLAILSFVILVLTLYFHDSLEDAGSTMMQYSFYVMFMIFTGKMNARNNMMFDIFSDFSRST